jgi:hypothetical protein
MHRTTVVVAILVAASSPAAAQTCLGHAPFTRGPIQLRAVGELSRVEHTNPTQMVDLSTAGAGLSIGMARRGPFVGVTGTVTSNNIVDGTTKSLGANVGWQVPISFDGGARAEICPYAEGSMGTGPERASFDSRDARVTRGAAGLKLGAAFGGSRRVHLVPTVGYMMGYDKFDLEDDDNAQGTQPDDTETFGLVDLGMGLQFNNRFTLLPLVRVPLGLDNTDPIYGLTLGINFGGKARR